MSDKKKTVTVTGPYRTDLNLALLWLKSNKGISATKKVYKTKNGYAAKVVTKISKSELRNLAKDRFGVFINVR